MKAKSHVFQLPESDTKITLLYLPQLDLYVVTDGKGFGQSWVRVSYLQKVVDARMLMGVDDNQLISSLARYLAKSVIEKKLASTSNQLLQVDQINLTFSISLRNMDPNNVRLIKEEFSKQLNIEE